MQRKGTFSPLTRATKKTNQWGCAVEPVLMAERRTAAVKAPFNHEMEEPQARGKAHQVGSPVWILIPVVNL